MVNNNFDEQIENAAQNVFNIMAQRVSETELSKIKEAFEFARQAHANQYRKGGEPYILHPIAVATIVADDIHLGANPVIAAFLHDVVEDTDYTLDDIRTRFGDDVAFLVKALTKEKKDKYEMSRQLDNYKQMLNALQYDIRAILVKLADRLHNMRTLKSMRADKQMKIAGETDYFYAPLANRLGLYHIKTELENLSLRFRCPDEYETLVKQINADREANREKLEHFMDKIRSVLEENGIHADVYAEYRQPYSLWRKMQKYGDDFNHLKYRHFIEVVYDTPQDMSEKEMALKIYSILTDNFKEKPGGIINYIDSPKENGYRSFHIKLLSDFGRWQETHLSSRQMIRTSQFGCVAERSEQNIERWIAKFRNILRDIAMNGQEGDNFIEKVVSSFYNDDIMTFTPTGKPMILPQKATVLDFAFELHTDLGMHARYALINNRLASVKTRLHRGDVVEIVTDPAVFPSPDWLNNVVTYKAKKLIGSYLSKLPKSEYHRCECCNPIPGEEVIGYRESNGEITVHKRDCPVAIRLASKHGDNIVSVNYKPDTSTFPVSLSFRAVDRPRLLIDLLDSITKRFNLSIDKTEIETVDGIVDGRIWFPIHSFGELREIMNHFSEIDGMDEVKRES